MAAEVGRGEIVEFLMVGEGKANTIHLHTVRNHTFSEPTPGIRRVNKVIMFSLSISCAGLCRLKYEHMADIFTYLPDSDVQLSYVAANIFNGDMRAGGYPIQKCMAAKRLAALAPLESCCFEATMEPGAKRPMLI